MRDAPNCIFYIARRFAFLKLCWAFRITLMLGTIEGRRRRGGQRMRWLNGITDGMGMRKLPGHREEHGTIHGVAKSWTRQSNRTPPIQAHKTELLSKSASCSVVSDFLRPHGLQPARLLCPWNSPGSNAGVDCHSLLQSIFPTKGSSLRLLLCRRSFSVQAAREALSHNIILTINFLSDISSLLGIILSSFSGITFERKPNLDFL